jgi:hypothetical protein
MMFKILLRALLRCHHRHSLHAAATALPWLRSAAALCTAATAADATANAAPPPCCRQRRAATTIAASALPPTRSYHRAVHCRHALGCRNSGNGGYSSSGSGSCGSSGISNWWGFFYIKVFNIFTGFLNSRRGCGRVFLTGILSIYNIS